MEAQFHDIYKYIYKCTVCTGTYLTAYQRHLILREFQVPTVCQYQSRLATSRLRNARRDKEVERRSRESTCSACGILNLICILLARKNWVWRKYVTAGRLFLRPRARWSLSEINSSLMTGGSEIHDESTWRWPDANKICFSGQSLPKIRRVYLYFVCRKRFEFELSPKAFYKFNKVAGLREFGNPRWCEAGQRKLFDENYL